MSDYINSETKEKYSESEVYEMYDESLDDLYDTGVWCMGRDYYDSDPIAYNVGFDDYLDSQNIIEYDPEDDEQEESE